MNFRKAFLSENKSGYNLLLISGIILPILIPLAFGFFEDINVSDFWIYPISCYLIFWVLVFPSLCRLHHYSLFLFRLTISLSLVIPFVLSFILKSPETIQRPITRNTPLREILERHNSIPSAPPLEQIKVFIIAAGVFWVLTIVILWIYDGYLKSKKQK